MKRIYDEADGMLVVGTAREIKSAWNQLFDSESCIPYYCEEPKFSKTRRYGLCIDRTERIENKPVMQVVSGETARMFEKWIKETRNGNDI